MQETIARLKIIMLTSRFPYPLEKGDKLRAYHQIRTISQFHDVYLISIGENPLKKKELEEIRPFVKSLYVLKINPFQRLKSIIHCIFTNLPFQIAYFQSAFIQKKINSIVEDIQPDHIYCQLARMAEYVKELSIPKTLDYMDAFGIGMLRRANVVNAAYRFFYRMEASRMIRYEKEIFSYFDHHTIISAQDKKQFGFKGADAIRVIPNGIEDRFFNVKIGTKLHDIAFIGNMGYLPNIEAAEYLINIIKPKLNKNLKILIAGARPHRRVKKLNDKNVEIAGWIPDITQAYASAKIFVAPLWSGTGQQNKILEAMAIGLPCVTTTPVNNAINAQADSEIMIADNVETFITKIELLLNDSNLSQGVSNKGRQFVKQNYSWEHYSVLLSSIFAAESKK